MSNDINILCINRINSLYETMTPTEKSIADFIIDNYERVANFSCAELAEETESSPATVIRFSKKIGFDSFVEMKLSLSKQWLEDTPDTANVQRNDPVAITMQKVLMFNRSVIDGMKETLKISSLEQAVDLLCNAKHILIIGDGGSGTSARNAYDVFLQLHLHCEYVSDPFFQIMKIDQLGPKDLILAVSNSGRSKNTFENLKHAHERNIPTIGIVGMPNSPMAKYLNVELHTNCYNSSSFSDSVAAQICELNAIAILHAMIMQRKDPNEMFIGHQLTNAYDMKRVTFND